MAYARTQRCGRRRRLDGLHGRYLSVVVRGLLALAIAAPGVAPAVARRSATDTGAVRTGERYEVVASLPVGSEPGMVGIERPGDGEAWGPAAFDVDADGSVYVVDGVNRDVDVLDSGGAHVCSFALPPDVVGPTDIDVTESGIYLLDTAHQPAMVHLLGTTGALEHSWEIPPEYTEQWVSAVRVTERGDCESGPAHADGHSVDIALEIDGAWEVPLVTRGERVRTRAVPLEHSGNIVDIEDSERQGYAVGVRNGDDRLALEKDWATWDSAAVTRYRAGIRTARMEIESHNRVGAIGVVDSDDAGNVYVFAEDLGARNLGFVKVFDASGEPVRSCLLPLEDRETCPASGIRITASGEVLVMIPSATSVSIVRMRQERDTGDALCDPDENPPAPEVELPDVRAEGLLGWLESVFTPESACAIWDRIDAFERAKQYCNNRWYCTVYNYYPNSVNIRPRYITSYNRYWQSVPYCWGGWDLPSTFNSLMSSRYDAGDINTSTPGKLSGTAGADCSGLVSRLWGLGHKRSTSCAPYWGLGSTEVSYYIGLPGSAGERFGDIYLKPNSHVMLVGYVTLGGARVYEATKSNSYDRVVNPVRAWTAMPGYYARRNVNWWK